GETQAYAPRQEAAERPQRLGKKWTLSSLSSRNKVIAHLPGPPRDSNCTTKNEFLGPRPHLTVRPGQRLKQQTALAHLKRCSRIHLQQAKFASAGPVYDKLWQWFNERWKRTQERQKAPPQNHLGRHCFSHSRGRWLWRQSCLDPQSRN